MTWQVQYREFGGPEVLEYVEVPTPEAPAVGVVVETRAIGVNPIDSKLRAGLRKSDPITAPRVPGSDVAGVVVAVGLDVDDWNLGDEVIVRNARGAYTTHVVASEDQLVRKPAGVGWDEAASLGIPIGTAYQALKSLGVAQGSTVLVHAGSGAVGQAAVQFARDWGAVVVATASERNQVRLAELGAIPVVYGDGLLGRLRAALREAAAQNGAADAAGAAGAGGAADAAGGSGAGDGGDGLVFDAVLDAAGTDEALRASFALVSDRSHIGTIVVGAKAAGLGIRAWSGGSPDPLTDEEILWRDEAVGVAAELIELGEFDVEIGARFPLSAAAEAQAASMDHSARGKIILDPTL